MSLKQELESTQGHKMLSGYNLLFLISACISWLTGSSVAHTSVTPRPIRLVLGWVTVRGPRV